MKKNPAYLLVTVVVLFVLVLVFGIKKKNGYVNPFPRIKYTIDQKYIPGHKQKKYIIEHSGANEMVISKDTVLIPTIILPDDSLFWFYRFYGKKSYGTFYNNLYNLTFQDFGDSLDMQFEIFKNGIDKYCNNGVVGLKKKLKLVTTVLMIVLSLIVLFVIIQIKKYLT